MNRRAARRFAIGCLLSLLSLLSLFSLSACSGGVKGSETAPAPGSSVEPTLQATLLPGGVQTLTAAPELPVKVVAQAAIRDLRGNVHVLGEVVNTSGSTVEEVSLAVAAYDASGASLLKAASGETLQEAAFSPMVPRFADGQLAPFDYVLPAGSSIPAVYQVSVTAYRTSEVQLLTVQVENTQIMISDTGEAVLVGELVNANPISIRIEACAGMLLDGSNNPLSASDPATTAGVLLAAGEPNQLDRAPFKIPFHTGMPDGANWRVFVDAEPAAEAEATAFAIDQAGVYYEDSRGAGHLVSSIKNDAEQSFSVQLLAGLFSSTGSVMDVSLLEIPIDLQPGQEIPFDVHGFSLLDGHADQQAKLAGYTLQVDPARTQMMNQVWQQLTPDEPIQEQGEDGVWTFSGSVANSMETNFGRIVVMGILEDHSTGKVVAVSTADLVNPAGAIEPGMRMEYSFEVNADPAETTALDALVRVYALVD